MVYLKRPRKTVTLKNWIGIIGGSNRRGLVSVGLEQALFEERPPIQHRMILVRGYPLKAGQVRGYKKELRSFLSRLAVVALVRFRAAAGIDFRCFNSRKERTH
jgi:hypothetical protein